MHQEETTTTQLGWHSDKPSSNLNPQNKKEKEDIKSNQQTT